MSSTKLQNGILPLHSQLLRVVVPVTSYKWNIYIYILLTDYCKIHSQVFKDRLASFGETLTHRSKRQMVKTYMESSKQGLATSAVKSGKLGFRRDSNATYMLQWQGFPAEKCITPKLSSQGANCAILASPKPQQIEYSAEIRNCRLVSGVPKMKCELKTPRMRRTRCRGRWNGWLQRPKKQKTNNTIERQRAGAAWGREREAGHSQMDQI